MHLKQACATWIDRTCTSWNRVSQPKWSWLLESTGLSYKAAWLQSKALKARCWTCNEDSSCKDCFVLATRRDVKRGMTRILDHSISAYHCGQEGAYPGLRISATESRFPPGRPSWSHGGHASWVCSRTQAVLSPQDPPAGTGAAHTRGRSRQTSPPHRSTPRTACTHTAELKSS